MADTEDIIKVSESDRYFAEDVKHHSGVDFNRCLFCRSCGNGCPFDQAMDYHPYAVLRLIQYGLREKALGCSTIWVCVSCHTCSSQCPMSIDIPAVMHALCSMALEEHVAPDAPDILDFHLEALRSIEKHGRAHKLGIMFRHKLITGQWFKDFDLGLRMLAKRKLDLLPSRVQAMEEIIRLFTPDWKAYLP